MVLTIQALAKAGSTISVTGSTSFTYNGSAQGPNTSTVTGSGGTVIYSYEGVSGTSYTASLAQPTAVGSYRVTATVPEDTNYNTATSSAYAFTIVASGTTFAGLFGTMVNPTNIGSDGLTYLMKYALGGTNTNDKVSLPTVSLNGSILTMTALVRTNDTNLTIVGQSLTDLTGTWTTISPNSKGFASTNTNSSGVPAGCQRRDFNADGGTNKRTFLRLKASQ